MGWLCTNKSSGMSVTEFLQGRLSDRYKILDSALVEMREWYAACRDTETGEVFALVYEVKMYNSERENFCWKSMDETWGPYQTNCPARILNKLTPTNNQYAIEWREKCKASLERKSMASGLQDGDIIRFQDAIHFTDERTWDTFRIVKQGRKIRFRAIMEPAGEEYRTTYQISGWKKRPFSVITTVPVMDDRTGIEVEQLELFPI